MTEGAHLEHPEQSALASPCSAHLVALVGPARAGRLIIYAGAGISLQSGLPTARELSERLHTRLKNLGFELSEIDPSDLLAVADAVGTDAGGLRVLQNAALEAFNFEGAPVSPTHRALALLLLEGAIQVLTTNWDTCIERAAAPERLMSVVTPEDRLQVQGESLLKVHGSADRPTTLLVTSAQLGAPPVWASTTIAAALTSATVVFLGIGDVAPYVRLGLDQVVAELRQLDNVAVVSPSIEERWDTSQWSTVLPGLPEDRRWGTSAGDFAHGLLSAWINNALADAEAMAHALGLPQLPAAFDALHAVLRAHNATRVCTWLRRSHMSPKVGKSVGHSDGASQVLLALALHTAASPVSSVPVHGPIRTAASVLELIIAPDRTPGLLAADEAFRRAHEYRQMGELGPSEDLMAVCAGHTGPFHDLQAGAPQNLVDDDCGTIMSGGMVNLVSAGALLTGAVA